MALQARWVVLDSLDKMGQVVTQEARALLAPKVLQDHRVILVLKDIQGSRVQLAEQDLQVQLVKLDQEEIQVLQDSKDHKGNLVMLDRLELQELVVYKVHVVMWDQRVPLVTLVTLARLEQPVVQELRDHQVRLVSQVPRGHWEQLEFRVREGTLVYRATLDKLVHKVVLVGQELQEMLVNSVFQVR